MSKHDFSTEEFASRLARTRAAIADAGLDWLLVFHPVSIHWLTGSDAKSYQEFQCLFVAAADKPLGPEPTITILNFSAMSKSPKNQVIIGPVIRI